jgi:lipopolysaccharide export LptBFGC system permease protein LptF
MSAIAEPASKVPRHTVTPAQLRAYLVQFLRGDYAKGFFRRVAITAAAVIALVEAIFLAEHFTWVFRDAAKHEANLLDIAGVLLCTSTGIFDLALAIALFIAVYTALLQMRERRELLVLFASGLGPYQLSAMLLVAAVAGQLIGIAGSGIADPVSKYTQRAILFSAELHALKKGVAQGEFYYFPGYVAYATEHGQGANEAAKEVAAAPLAPVPSAAGLPNVIDARPQPRPISRDRTLFVYQQIAPHASRVITAAQARLDGPDKSGKITLNLGDFTSHTFADAHPLTMTDAATADPKNRTMKSPCATCADDMKGMPNITMNVHDMYQLMMVDQLLPFDKRGSDPQEQTIFEQLGPDHAATPFERKLQMKLLAERFSRSLLSFLAPLMALAALCLTSRRTNWFVLPVACLALMSVYLVSEWLVSAVTPKDVPAALLPPLLLALLVAILSVSLVLKRQDDIARPALGHG